MVTDFITGWSAVWAFVDALRAVVVFGLVFFSCGGHAGASFATSHVSVYLFGCLVEITESLMILVFSALITVVQHRHQLWCAIVDVLRRCASTRRSVFLQ